MRSARKYQNLKGNTDMSNGWIKLYRQLQDCPIWYGERFSKGQAWVDLLLLANHSDKKTLFNGEIIRIGRGQYLTSMVKLAEKWSWNRKTVSSYLNMLEKEKMITRVSDNTKTLITIENYENYQGCEETDGQLNTQPNGQPIGQQRDNPLDSRTDTNKNIKNDKNINNNIVGANPTRKIFIPPTVNEVQAYCNERNNNVDAQKFVDFYECKGWMVGKNKMKDWKAAIRNWERMDNSKSKTVSPKKSKQSFDQRTYDYDELERQLIANRNKNAKKRKEQNE